MTPEFGEPRTAPRTAIVTGGARRIGEALSRALAADGWTVLIHCHASEADGAALAEELGGRCVCADLAEPDCAERIVGARAGLPPPGLLVNSASRFVLDQIDDFDAAGWDAHAAVNLRAPALLTQAFARAVPDGASALIVNILDAKLAQPNPDFFSYTVSKMGLAGLTELSARALAGRGIRVNAVAPSITLVSGEQTRDNFDEVHRLNALRRGIDVGQIVDALRYLVRTPTITGQTITLDAGQRFLSVPRDVQFLSAEARRILTGDA